MGFAEFLTLIFVAAKLLGLITWSWWWVFSPMLFALAVLAVAGVVFIILAIMEPRDHG